MRALADLAERFGHDELRISHEQNVILPHVHKSDLPEVYIALRDAGLATANVGRYRANAWGPGRELPRPTEKSFRETFRR